MKINNILFVSGLFSLVLSATAAKTALAEEAGGPPFAIEKPAPETGAAHFGDGPKGEMREKIKNMAPEDRKAFLAERHKNFENMTPEQRLAMKEKKEAWLSSLPPEKRAKIEARMKKRQEMREKMKNMTPEERQAFKQQFREKMQERRKDGPQDGGDGFGGGGEFRRDFGNRPNGGDAGPAAPAR